MKKPVNHTIYRLLVFSEIVSVESPGIEPGSKQATKELSTRLFPVWVFDVGLGQEQPPNA